jgi:hypothetical protein
MPRQNRVAPTGELIATPTRGMLMGNRGILHDDDGHIRRLYVGRRWIICVLSFKGRQRQVMSPGQYTELFFYDEAVAFAAGHRPCAECQRDRFNLFKQYWARVTGADPNTLKVDEIDSVLHRERLTSDRCKRTYRAPLDSLPDGVFILGSTPVLVLGTQLYPWTPEGYGAPFERPTGVEVEVLTPPSLVALLASGYRVQISLTI